MALWRVLVPACALARWAMLLAIFAFPTALPGGLAGRFKRRCGWPQLAHRHHHGRGREPLLPRGVGPGLLALLGLATLLWSLGSAAPWAGTPGTPTGRSAKPAKLLALAALAALGRFGLL